MAGIQEVKKSTASHLLQLISRVSEKLPTMEMAECFDPIKELGTGSYGKVLLAKHRHSGEMAAVKFLRKEKTLRDNFLVEYGISLSLSHHPHIITTYDVAFQTSNEYVFAQEVAQAGTMLSMVKPKVGMNEELLKRCVPQICTALDYMHSHGLIHHDVKLDNILLMDPECHRVKLSDFGLTRLQGTFTPAMSWYIPYMAPELCSLGKGESLLLHYSLDVWAFGVLLYIALIGSFPWQSALHEDDKYRDFASWQGNKDLTAAPGNWENISLTAREMFWSMLALDANERCSAMDCVQYVCLPWKGGT